VVRVCVYRCVFLCCVKSVRSLAKFEVLVMFFGPFFTMVLEVLHRGMYVAKGPNC
jgi:hypothetical protein